ncbi:hypothetical protein ACFFX0_25755 [Citricoccus parietis]|uniref:Uncharacterized protein n=1 Tax=Citricoccus parietis TaxID=592307 RepID=A0ABV5G681_9MICC
MIPHRPTCLCGSVPPCPGTCPNRPAGTTASRLVARHRSRRFHGRRRISRRSGRPQLLRLPRPQ